MPIAFPMDAPPRGESRGGADAELKYCREMLPRVSRTFAANIGVLRGSMADAVTVAYLLCRTADALEDSWPGTPAELAGRFELLLGALALDRAAAESLARRAATLAPGRADLELVAHLPVLLDAFESLAGADRRVIAETVRTMAHGMRRFAVRGLERARAGATPAYLDSEAELHEY